MRVILGGIDGREFSLTEDITVYAASDVRKFGNAKDILSVLDG
jgi:putative transposon-encoded protein